MYTFPLKPRLSNEFKKYYCQNNMSNNICQMRNSEGKKLKYARVS